MFQASPVAIGGRQAIVEEKKSTNSRGKWSIVDVSLPSLELIYDIYAFIAHRQKSKSVSTI